jgi:hypothetical protein
MAKLTGCLSSLLGMMVGGMLLASCGGANEPARAPAQAAPTATSPLTVVDITHHYADLLANGAHLATPASRRYASTAAVADTDTSFSLMLPHCEIVALLTKQQQLVHVFVLPHPAPEDPNRIVMAVPQPPAHLVRLGELRHAFGTGASLPPPLHVLPHYRFAYQPTPNSRSVTIEAFMPAPTYVDSAHAEHLMLYLTPPK